MYRSRSIRKKYAKERAAGNYDADCILCRISSTQIIEKTRYFYIVENIYPYSIWDHYRLDKHWMLVPKRHIISLDDFTEQESQAAMKLLQKYEKAGFSVYARTPRNTMKTVAHQHTHLIKAKGKEQKFLLYIKKPHIHWHR